MMVLWFYNAVVLLASPLWGLWLVWRLVGQRKDRLGFRQRWQGLAPASLPPGTPSRHPRIWVHAVSVGEAMAAAPVVRALRRRFPQALLVGSTVTDLGQVAMKTKLPELDLVFYLPFDLLWAVRRTIRTIQPDLFLCAELELWPNLLFMLDRAGVPAVLVNGRLSERSLRRYGRVAPVIRRVVETIDGLAVQSDADRGRFIRLGADPARVVSCGNLKADGAVVTDDQSLKQALGLRTESLLVAGSTHAPEEVAVARAFLALLPERPELRLCIAPRHLERCRAIEVDLEGLGLIPRRRSRFATSGRSWDNPLDVVLLDTIGELAACYQLAAVTIMGGTFAPIGGHNLLEPAAAGRPVVIGPHVTGQWVAVAEGLKAAGGAVRLQSDAELASALRALLGNSTALVRMGTAAHDYLVSQRGATDRTMAVIDRTLATDGVPEAAGVRPYRADRLRLVVARWLGATGGVVSLIKALLWPVAGGYGLLMALRRTGYRRGWFPVSRLPVVVVSIGNLTVGGSGKTPLVLELAQRLHTHTAGRPVGIVLRGYRGRRAEDPLLVSNGRLVTVTVDQAGDEAFLLARRLPGIPVAVGHDRAEAGRLLLGRCAPELLLIDDGFQHLSLFREVNLLVIDAGQLSPDGGLAGLPLPCGLLREWWSAVRDASAIVLMQRGERIQDDALRPALLSRLRRRGFTGPLFAARLQPVGVVSAIGPPGEVRPLRSLAGARVVLCAGIGQPRSFREMAAAAGALICGEWLFGDHHDYTGPEMAALAGEARRLGAAMVVTTEKDLVKMADWPATAPPLVALRIAACVEPEPEWQRWLIAQRLLPDETGEPGGEPRGEGGTGRSHRPAGLLCGAPHPGGG